jgi:hypothetical protein
MTAKAIAAALQGRRSGSGWMARCPAHEDRGPSLSICEKNGKILVHCFAGCSQREVIAALMALGLWLERERRDWTPAERREWKRQRRELDKHSSAAVLWCRAALILGENVLEDLREGLWDGSLPEHRFGEIAWWTSLLARWQTLDGLQLVAEYKAHLCRNRRMATALVRAGRNLELAELRRILMYINAEEETVA